VLGGGKDVDRELGGQGASFNLEAVKAQIQTAIAAKTRD
jgi:hypothetical protein